MRLLLFILTFVPTIIFGQEIDTLNPILGWTVDKSIEGEIEHLKQVKKCETFWTDYHKKYGEGGFIDTEKLTEKEKELFDECAAAIVDFKPYWDILGVGCSWYCGARKVSVSATSELAPHKDIKYSASNANDLSYKTAWVEGVSGYGIGEYLVYHVQPTNPRITEIIIVNGYVKSDKTWKENSRVKRLKMYVDDKPYAILNLQDSKTEQHFKVEPLGVSKRDNWDEMKKMPIWTLKFEIVETYPGDKNDDVAITEIYFDGIDVHCLAKGTEITLPDWTTEKIEMLQTGDSVLSYNQTTNRFEPAEIQELASPIHSGLVAINFSNGTKLSCTKDHPLKSKNGLWTSLEPEKTMIDYNFNQVEQLKIGDEIMTADTTLMVASIESIYGFVETYTIVRLDKNNAFIANGVVVGTEEKRKIKLNANNGS